jgi:cytoskeletal protein RodZ
MISMLLQDSLGKRLHDARTHRGMNVLDAAFYTRIPADRIRELENDDYSNFANLTYAKSFLKLYASHLSVDISEQLREFSATAANAVPVEYLTPTGTPTLAEIAKQRAEQKNRHWSIALKAAPLVLGLAGLTWLGSWIFTSKDEPEQSPAPTTPETAAVEPATKAEQAPAPITAPQTTITKEEAVNSVETETGAVPPATVPPSPTVNATPETSTNVEANNAPVVASVSPQSPSAVEPNAEAEAPPVDSTTVLPAQIVPNPVPLASDIPLAPANNDPNSNRARVEAPNKTDKTTTRRRSRS